MTNPRIKNIYVFPLLGLLFLITLNFISNLVTTERKFWTEFYQIAGVVDFSVMKRIPPDKPITLMFVGDIMLDRGVEHMVKRYGENDFRFPFLKIKDGLDKADILFGNLESVISDKGTNVGTIYSFRAEPEAIGGLFFAGFDVLSVANNHVFDYSSEAMEDSFDRLNKVGIEFVGGGLSYKEAHSPVIKKVKGLDIAYLAYNSIGSRHWWEAKEDHSGIAWLDEDMVEDIKKAKQASDLVVVSMHFGDEYKTEPGWQQKNLAYLAIDAGAGLVIGHHPHVSQPVERYKQGYIAYSLGNFVFDQYFSAETMQGLLLEVIIEDGKIKEVNEIKVKINSFYQPEIIYEK